MGLNPGCCGASAMLQPEGMESKLQRDDSASTISGRYTPLLGINYHGSADHQTYKILTDLDLDADLAIHKRRVVYPKIHLLHYQGSAESPRIDDGCACRAGASGSREGVAGGSPIRRITPNPKARWRGRDMWP